MAVHDKLTVLAKYFSFLIMCYGKMMVEIGRHDLLIIVSNSLTVSL